MHSEKSVPLWFLVRPGLSTESQAKKGVIIPKQVQENTVSKENRLFDLIKKIVITNIDNSEIIKITLLFFCFFSLKFLILMFPI